MYPVVRLAGGFLLVACGAAAGFSAAGRLSERAARIRLLHQLVVYFTAELRASLAPVPELICAAGRNPAFVGLAFLGDAAGRAGDFPACWADALRRDTVLTPAERAAMAQVGEILGSTALEGQLALLRLQAERLAAMQEEAEQESLRRGNLCRSLGILAGIFAVILLV